MAPCEAVPVAQERVQLGVRNREPPMEMQRRHGHHGVGATHLLEHRIKGQIRTLRALAPPQVRVLIGEELVDTRRKVCPREPTCRGVPRS